MFSEYSKENPKYLYKYCSLNNFSLQAIANGHFWFSKLNSFNDPFEPKSPLKQLETSMLYDQMLQAGIIQLDDVAFAQINNEYIYERNHHDFTYTYKNRAALEGFSDIYKEEDLELSEKRFDSLSRLYDKVGNMGVLWLSSNPSSVLMWSHYSDNHQGVCIQIERSQNSELMNCDQTFKVEYSNDYPNFDYFSKITDVSERYLKQSIVARKGFYWSYEEEWRVLKEEGNRIYDTPGKITGVIFGLRTSFSQKAAIAKLLINSDINAYEVRRREGEYLLDVKSMGEPHQST